MLLTVEQLPDHDDSSLPSLFIWHTLKVTSRGKLRLRRAEGRFISTAHVLCTLIHNYSDFYICFKGKKSLALIWQKRNSKWSNPHRHSTIRARVCSGWCLCGCVCTCVFTQLEEQSGITSPSGSWGVCCDPIKRQTGSGTHSRNPEDFTC